MRSRSARVARTVPGRAQARTPKYIAVGEYQTSTSVESSAGCSSGGAAPRLLVEPPVDGDRRLEARRRDVELAPPAVVHRGRGIAAGQEGEEQWRDHAWRLGRGHSREAGRIPRYGQTTLAEICAGWTRCTMGWIGELNHGGHGGLLVQQS